MACRSRGSRPRSENPGVVVVVFVLVLEISPDGADSIKFVPSGEEAWGAAAGLSFSSSFRFTILTRDLRSLVCLLDGKWRYSRRKGQRTAVLLAVGEFDVVLAASKQCHQYPSTWTCSKFSSCLPSSRAIRPLSCRKHHCSGTPVPVMGLDPSVLQFSPEEPHIHICIYRSTLQPSHCLSSSLNFFLDWGVQHYANYCANFFASSHADLPGLSFSAQPLIESRTRVLSCRISDIIGRM